MPIKIPKTFMGKPVEGSLEKLLSEINRNPDNSQTAQPQIQVPDLQGYIYVPSINLYVAKQRTLKGLDWNQTHEGLHKQGLKMPTIYEFKEFLKYLKQNPNGASDATQQETADILDDILTVRTSWRAEWLDAKFEKKGKNWIIHYNHYINNNQITPRNSEKLEPCLMNDKTPGIEINDWLNNSTKHGLPKPDIKEGELYYWFPRNGSVSRFDVFSGRAFLDCGRDPAGTNPSLGVYACREAAQKN